MKQHEVTEYTPPTGFKSEPRRNDIAREEEVIEENGEGEKVFSRLKIPAIELTKPNKQGSGDNLAGDPTYITADNKSVKSMDSMKDVSTLIVRNFQQLVSPFLIKTILKDSP